MKRFSAQYIFTCSGKPLKRAIVNTEDDGTIINIEDTGGRLPESSAVSFFNGIIIPGFVNCHCHLELSHLKGTVKNGGGLPGFIMQVRLIRDKEQKLIMQAIESADNEMDSEGIVLCADICNNASTFDLKKKSKIKYINLLEVFGIDPEKAHKRMSDVLKLADEAQKQSLPYNIVPHSVYSVSLPLFNLIKNSNPNPRINSIHFQETEAEAEFLSDHKGPLKASYEAGGMMPATLNLAQNHIKVILEEIPMSGSLILVHNTYTNIKTIHALKSRPDTYRCLCPGSNMYIEEKLPPVDLLIEEECNIVIGTDSLASNTQLSILSELKLIQENFPGISLDELILWSTLNGAKALHEENLFGSIEPGKKPGLLLLENIDLQNLKLLPDTKVKKLI